MSYEIKIFDFEVFAYNWLLVFSNTDGTDIHVIHNDNAELKRQMLKPNTLWGGFNNKHYDNWIANCIIAGATPEQVKECNDFIIGGGNGWDYPLIQGIPKQFISFDLKDDIPDMGLSLKAIEGNIGADIRESKIDFTITHKLSDEELEEVITYCKSDVANTVRLYHLRKSYLEGKISVGKLKGWDEAVSLPLTNPKLTAKFLGAKLVKRNDEFIYEPPKELVLKKYTEPLEFYKNIDYEKKLELDVLGVTQHYGWGGIHSAREHYSDASTDKEKIVDIDVGSYYPSLMIQYGYTSRNIPEAKGYADIYHKRLKAKHTGDTEVANSLKLVLNSTFGASKSQYNDLYDARQANAICITGQLFLTMLLEMLEQVKGLVLIQTNTDGIMIKYPVRQEKKVQAIVTEWERITRMNMEYTEIHRIVQKDVNNYVLEAGATYLYKDGVKQYTKEDKHKISTKGGWLSLWNGGSFRNNSLVIVHKALVEYFMHDIKPEDTINQATNILDFQMITKTGSTYKGAIHIIDGKDIQVQRVNRVYATKDAKYGQLFKVKDGRRDKIADVPEHCIIDNSNQLKIEDIDKEFYINLAYKRIADFMGEQKPKAKKRRDKMATTTDYSKINMAQRLLLSRVDFLEANVKKSGENKYTGFNYFELSDIVPTATRIMAKYGLLPTFTFMDDIAYANIRDAYTYPDDTPIEFQFKTESVKLSGGANAMQNLGASQTYARRYLWYLVLDIVEQDTFDATLGKNGAGANESLLEPSNSDTGKTSKGKPPATPEERKEIVEELTNTPISKLQRGSIVNGLTKLKKANEEKHRAYIDGIKAKIKESDKGTAVITSKDAEAILLEIGEKLSEG